jgi:hypothetical protein
MTTLGVMKRLVTTIAVVLGLVGCGPSGGPLLTGDPLGNGWCYLAEGGGRLVVDPSYGTAIIPPDGSTGTLSDRRIVAWRPGYTARRSGPEVEVLDPQGRVVATTGRSYLLRGGYADPGNFGRPDLPSMVWWTCEDPELLP